MADFAMMAVLLIGGHALADYPLQGDFLSKGKNRTAPIPGMAWQQLLAAHCAIHGAVVALVTGIWWLAIAEAAVHFVTDDAKCRGAINFNQDQAIHYVSKAIWLAVAWWLA